MCNVLHMATNIQLDDRLLKKAMSLSGIRTKKDIVHEALTEFVRKREQMKILDFFGTVDFDPDYHYKAQRRKS